MKMLDRSAGLNLTIGHWWPRAGTETDNRKKAPYPATFFILIDNESNMATNLAQQYSIVATDRKISNEIVEHFVLWTWQNVQRNNKIVGHFVRCYDIIMESESGQLWHGIIGNR